MVKFSIYLNRRVFVMANMFEGTFSDVTAHIILTGIQNKLASLWENVTCAICVQRIHIYVEQPTSLRKHAYSNILKILQPKTGKFPDKNYDIFHISAQNIDCGYSLEPPRRGGSCYRLGEAVLTSTHNLCFRAKIRKIMYTPVNPSFTI